MIEKFQALEEFEHLLMDDVGVVRSIRHNRTPGADEDLLIVLEDGKEVRCTTKQLYVWTSDDRGHKRFIHAPRFRQFLKPGTPVTFRWDADRKKPFAVVEWDPQVFNYVWKRYRYVGKRGEVIWEGRNINRLRKEHPKCGADRHRQWYVLSGGAWVKSGDPR